MGAHRDEVVYATKVGAAPATEGPVPMVAAQVAAAWMLAHVPTSVLISGSVDPRHVGENIAAGTVRLTADRMRRLDARAGAVAEG